MAWGAWQMYIATLPDWETPVPIKPKRDLSPQVASSADDRAGGLSGSIVLIWCVLGYGLVVYGVVEDRGPFACLIDVQRAAFGGSNVMVGAVAGVVLIFLAPKWVLRYLHRILPANALIADLDRRMHLATLSRSEAAARAIARWNSLGDAERLAVLRRRRNIALGVAAGVMLATWATNIYVRVSSNADAGQPLTRISPAAPISLGKASSWVHVVDGTPALAKVVRRDYHLRSTAYSDYYTPILPPGWKPGERVYLVELDDTIQANHQPADVPNPPGPIEGELSTGGTRNDIAASFVADGYDVGPWTAVLKRDISLDGKIPGEDDLAPFVIWWIGGMFAFVSLLIGIIAERQGRGVRRDVENAGTSRTP